MPYPPNALAQSSRGRLKVDKPEQSIYLDIHELYTFKLIEGGEPGTTDTHFTITSGSVEYA